MSNTPPPEWDSSTDRRSYRREKFGHEYHKELPVKAGLAGDKHPFAMKTLFDVAKGLLGNILVSVDLQCHLR